ncbi:MAG: hypothetical protein HYY38_03145 [Rhodospirillales bacterium]|nr:hypothetical protein [Rhodospirillales bacterium]
MLGNRRRRLPPEKELGAVFHKSVEDMLPHCDFLTVHCNVTPETRGLMNASIGRQRPARKRGESNDTRMWLT